MKNGRTLIILGALVIVAPFIGLPYSWLRFMLPVLGALVLVAGVRSRPRRAQEPVPAAEPSYDEQDAA